jgi:uncharacterized phage protein gp47/JayE
MAVDVPTFDELYEAVESEIQSRNDALTDFNPGSALDAITGGMAMGAEESIRIGLKVFASKFLDTAEGDDLDDVISDWYPDMEGRRAASAAVVTLTFTRGGSSGVLEIPAGTACRATVNGQSVTFETDAAVYMPAVANTVTSVATCTSTGTTGNVAVATITTIVDAIPGDATATVSNAERAVGGAAEEDDDTLRARARLYHSTLRRATVGALEAAALAVPGVRFATVDESNMAPDDGGYVSVYVGDPDARSNAALAAAVETALDDVRAAGVDVRVSSAERQEISLTFVVYTRAGADRAAIVTAARAAALAYINGLAANETMYLSQVNAAACGVSSEVLGCSITTPTSDQVPSAGNKAIRVPDASLSVTATEA